MIPAIHRSAALLLGLLFLGGGAVHLGAVQAPDALAGPGAGVPYVAQGPLLCGGAAAAMVERYWGALGVYAEDYQEWVRPSEGGIRTGELVQALERRGHDVRVSRNQPTAVLDRVRSGVPAIVLLSSGRDRYHYVVAVAAASGSVMIHDPLRAPGLTLERAAFLERWGESEFWAAFALPAFQDTDPSADVPDAPSGAPQGDPPPEAIARAVEELRAGRPDRAEAAVGEFLAGAAELSEEHRALAWRTMASARYLADQPGAALDAWNRVDEPRVDLVRVQGLESMHHQPLVAFLGLAPRELLTAAMLARARRRLQQHPAVALGQAAYRPLRDGSVEVAVALLERPKLPDWPLGLVAVPLNALLTGTWSVGFGPFMGVGERWRVQGSWESARPGYGAQVAVPVDWAGGVIRLDQGRVKERYQVGLTGDPPGRREWARVGIQSWRSSALRLGAGLGFERWAEEERAVGWAGASLLVSTPEAESGFFGEAEASLEAWSDDGLVGRYSVRGALAFDTPLPGRTRIQFRHVRAGTGAPIFLWPGAGTGRHRRGLLRGHPLDAGDRLGGGALGRMLNHGSVEQVVTLPLSWLPLQVVAFLDLAEARQRAAEPATARYADPGVELRLGVPGSEIAAALARGDGDWVFSVRVGGWSPLGLSAP